MCHKYCERSSSKADEQNLIEHYITLVLLLSGTDYIFVQIKKQVALLFCLFHDFRHNFNLKECGRKVVTRLCRVFEKKKKINYFERTDNIVKDSLNANK